MRGRGENSITGFLLTQVVAPPLCLHTSGPDQEPWGPGQPHTQISECGHTTNEGYVRSPLAWSPWAGATASPPDHPTVVSTPTMHTHRGGQDTNSGPYTSGEAGTAGLAATATSSGFSAPERCSLPLSAVAGRLGVFSLESIEEATVLKAVGRREAPSTPIRGQRAVMRMGKWPQLRFLIRASLSPTRPFPRC